MVRTSEAIIAVEYGANWLNNQGMDTKREDDERRNEGNQLIDKSCAQIAVCACTTEAARNFPGKLSPTNVNFE